MKVILLKRVEKLGQIGDLVDVKPGYARNYLLPKGYALRSTKENIAYFEQQKAQIEATNLKEKAEAEQISTKIEGVKVILVRQSGDAGQLYGSVNARDVANALKELGYAIARQQVRLSAPIKYLGLHDVIISLHSEVSVTIEINVARSLAEAEEQANLGKEGIARLRGEHSEEEEEVKEVPTPVTTDLDKDEIEAEQAEETSEDE